MSQDYLITMRPVPGEGADPADFPLCPICDEPIIVGDKLLLEFTVGAETPVVRLIHRDCADQDGEPEEVDENG